MAAAASISVTQVAVETLTLSPPNNIRTTQIVTELLGQVTVTAAISVSATQVAVETLSFTPGRIISSTQIATELLSTVSPIIPIVSGFNIDCQSKNMSITGTGLDTRTAIYLTLNGQPVTYALVYATPTLIVLNLPNFQSGAYSLRII